MSLADAHVMASSSWKFAAPRETRPGAPHAPPRRRRRRRAVGRRAPTLGRGGRHGPTSHNPTPVSGRPVMAAAGVVPTQPHSTARRRSRRRRRVEHIPRRETTEHPSRPWPRPLPYLAGGRLLCPSVRRAARPVHPLVHILVLLLLLLLPCCSRHRLRDGGSGARTLPCVRTHPPRGQPRRCAGRDCGISDTRVAGRRAPGR